MKIGNAEKKEVGIGGKILRIPGNDKYAYGNENAEQLGYAMKK